MVEIGLPDPPKTGGCVDHIREYFEKAIRDHPFKTSTFFMGRGQNWPNLATDSSTNC